MTKTEIKDWLDRIQKDREWLASQLGTTKATVDGWFSTRGFPKPALVNIERIMHETSISPSGKITASFTTDEFELIEAARAKVGNPSRPDFYYQAIMEYAAEILQMEAFTKTTQFPSTAGKETPIAEAK